MKRLVIFTVLFPPLALVVFIVPDVTSDRDFLEIGLLFWMLGYAYPIAVIPAWLTAGVDGLLRGTNPVVENLRTRSCWTKEMCPSAQVSLAITQGT